MTLSIKTKLLNALRLIFKVRPLEIILAKNTRSKPPGALIVKLVPNNYQYAPGTFRVATRNNITYKLDLHDYVDWWLYYGLQEKARENLYKLVAQGDLIIDIGTNVGETLMNFARLTGKDGRVFGFEPDPVNYQRCIHNLKLNNFQNIIVNRLGLGNVPSQLFLKVNTPSNRGGNRITNSPEGNYETIKVVTLDTFVIENQITKIDLLKIDVEGFELNVLLGAAMVLEKFKPKLFIEIDDNNLKEHGHSAAKLIAYIEKFDYSAINAETGEKISRAADFSNCHFDIICK